MRWRTGGFLLNYGVNLLSVNLARPSLSSSIDLHQKCFTNTLTFLSLKYTIDLIDLLPVEAARAGSDY